MPSNPRTLVVGSGGREHALAWKLSQETETLCCPGNPGIAQDVETIRVTADDADKILDLVREREVGLVVIGPENPLVAGLADQLRGAGVATYGPGALAAQLEGSKAFSKELMRKSAVPTADYEVFSSAVEAENYARRQYGKGIRLAVKASGVALGRGVTVADNLETALDAIERIMVNRQYGSAGETVVLEEMLLGREFSLLTIVGDKNFVSLPVAQDYKRALDGDTGPNTGGMGTFSPCPGISQTLVEEVENRMVEPILASLKDRGIPFRGTLFTGVMVTPEGPKCLEYNVRFGDPETQTIMMRLGPGLLRALVDAASGERVEPPEVTDCAAVTVVVASQGYPGAYKSSCPITVGPMPAGVNLFYAGVAGEPNALVTSGGRVVGVSARGGSLQEARGRAYAAARAVHFEGAYYRTDIAKRDL